MYSMTMWSLYEWLLNKPKLWSFSLLQRPRTYFQKKLLRVTSTLLCGYGDALTNQRKSFWTTRTAILSSVMSGSPASAFDHLKRDYVTPASTHSLHFVRKKNIMWHQLNSPFLRPQALPPALKSHLESSSTPAQGVFLPCLIFSAKSQRDVIKDTLYALHDWAKNLGCQTDFYNTHSVDEFSLSLHSCGNSETEPVNALPS